MDVRLTPDLEKIIQSKLESGLYNSPRDVISEALRLMNQRDEVRQKIAAGLESLKQGKGIGSDEAFSQLRTRHDQYKLLKRK